MLGGSSNSCTNEITPQRPVGPDSESVDLSCGIKKPVIHSLQHINSCHATHSDNISLVRFLIKSPCDPMHIVISGRRISECNMVSTVDLGCPIELRKLVLHVRSAEYNPRRFPGVVMRLREPRVTCLVFGTGRMVCTGARSESDANLGSRKCARILQRLGFDVKFMNFTIQNMVGLADLRFPIRLEGVQLANEQMTQYEPEIFPALIYRIIKPRLVMLIFVNGKIVMTGAKSREHLYEALNNVYPILYNYRKIN